jgi:HSP20 family protein
MNTLTKWNPFQTGYCNPFRELEEIESRLETLFHRSPLTTGRTRDESLFERGWSPSVDLTEYEKEFTVKADLPDVAKADIKLFVRDGVLEISGERKMEREQEGKRFHRSERCYGVFQRSFTLPQGAEGEKAKADFHHGVLTVHIPKNENSIQRGVAVKIT